MKYGRKEEYINVLTHGLGFILSVIALVALIVHSAETKNAHNIISSTIYGLSLANLYLASTLYHSAKKPSKRKKLQLFDHISIYILIAGTYTPYLMISLHGKLGWTLLITVWFMAVTGSALKYKFLGKYDLFFTILYILMGWVIIVAIKPLYYSVSFGGLFWLFLGGFFYTAGAVFYRHHKLKYNHAIFHVFVLLGSFSHFISICCYVV
jgi:hemolysin III